MVAGGNPLSRWFTGRKARGKPVPAPGDSESQEIGDILKVVAAIAEQTNLLVANATTGAARSSVAAEATELAQETARATGDLTAKVTDVQSEAARAAHAITQISQAIEQINDLQTTIASAIEEQTTANEISRNASPPVTAESHRAGVEEARAAATELARMSSDLQKLVSQFRP